MIRIQDSHSTTSIKISSKEFFHGCPLLPFSVSPPSARDGSPSRVPPLSCSLALAFRRGSHGFSWWVLTPTTPNHQSSSTPLKTTGRNSPTRRFPTPPSRSPPPPDSSASSAPTGVSSSATPSPARAALSTHRPPPRSTQSGPSR